jgi:hypothetical protein
VVEMALMKSEKDVFCALMIDPEIIRSRQILGAFVDQSRAMDQDFCFEKIVR